MREIGAAEFLPFGDDHKRVRADQRVVGRVDQLQPAQRLGIVAEIEREDAVRLVERDRIVRAHRRAARQQRGDQTPARRLAHVVGIRLERQPPDREAAPAQIRAMDRLDLVEQHVLLRVVDRLDRFQDAQRVAVLARGADQRLHVLREARAAVADPGVQEVIADPRIGTDAAPHRLDVRADAIREVRHLVHERDAGREHRVRRVLRELRRTHVHVDGALVVAVERRVQLLHLLGGQRAGFVGVDADDDAVRPHEVLDRRPFLEELGIRHDREAMRDAACETARGQRLVDHAAHALRGADRHRRLVDDHLVARHVAADVARRFEHVLQIGGAVLVGRRADRDELDLAVRDARFHIGGKRDAPGRAGARDDFLQARLVDRNPAVVQDLDLAGIDVEAKHVVPDFREARAGDETDVAGADDGDFHKCSGESFRWLTVHAAGSAMHPRRAAIN